MKLSGKRIAVSQGGALGSARLFVTYFCACLAASVVGYLAVMPIVILLFGCPTAFGFLPRMIMYHAMFPVQYMAIVAACYACVATAWTSLRRGHSEGWSRRGEIVAVIVVSLLFACPFGGILWHVHDMMAGFVPSDWLDKLLEGAWMGLTIGPIVLLVSIPYNILGLIAGVKITNAIDLHARQALDCDERRWSRRMAFVIVVSAVAIAGSVVHLCLILKCVAS